MIFSLIDDLKVLQAVAQPAFGSTPPRIGLTSGTYDLLHYLHLLFLQKCRRQCDFLVVGIDSDELVKKTKGPKRPIVPESQRVEMCNALRCVDAVFVMDDPEVDFLRAAKEFASVIFKNDQFPLDQIIGRDHAEVVIISDVRIPDSTSAIVNEIQRRTIETGQQQ